MLDEALAYQQRGLSIFPVCSPLPKQPGWCRQHGDHEVANQKRLAAGRQPLANPGKHPLVSWGELQHRVPTEDDVRSWWARWPDANIGMATGALSGLVVLDSDGFDAYTAVLSRGGVEPTPTVTTGKSNGFHWYLKHPGELVRNFAGDRGVEGLDFRGDGGYVVLPPSLHQTGAFYQWHISLEEMEPRDIPSWLLDLLTDKSRTNGTVAEDARTPIDIGSVLNGVPEGQRDDTLYRTACRLRSDNVPIDYADLLIRQAARNCSPPFSEEIAAAKVREAYRQFAPTIVLGGAKEEPETSLPKERFRLYTAAEMKNRQPPESLVEGVLFKNSLAALRGGEGTFKSFQALDMALSIAAGLPWQGRAIFQGPTLYISAEGSAGLKLRIEAWERSRACPLPETCFFLPEAVQFLRDGDIATIVEMIERLPEKPVFIVIDTLARTMVGGDENSAKDMGIYIAACDRLRVAAAACVLVIHHDNRAGGMRGSTALPGALDTQMDVKREDDFLTIECGKQKDAEEFLPINLVRRKVDLEDGNTSLIFDLTDHQIGSLDEKARKIGLILFETFGEEGATSTQWLQVSEEAKVSRASFYRGKRELVENGVVQAQNSGRGARYVVVKSQGLTKVSEGLRDVGALGLNVSHSFRSETLRPNAETMTPNIGPCSVCGSQNWRVHRAGWLCAECFPLAAS